MCRRSEQDAAARAQRFERTKALYRATFGAEPPAAQWVEGAQAAVAALVEMAALRSPVAGSTLLRPAPGEWRHSN